MLGIKACSCFYAEEENSVSSEKLEIYSEQNGSVKCCALGGLFSLGLVVKIRPLNT